VTHRASSPRARVAGYFLEPREAAAALDPAPATAVARFAPRAAVLGGPPEAPPVAAALANALRAHRRDAAAAVAVWAPSLPTAAGSPPGTVRAAAELAPAAPSAPAAPAALSALAAFAAPAAPSGSAPAAPAAPAAARLAARLTARGLASTARGRLAWLPLDSHPVAAALASRRAAAALEVPLVTALTGPRTDVLEGLLREQDLVVVVTRDPDGPLARLAVATSEVPAVACRPLPAGSRLLALAGLAGPRALPEPVREAARKLEPAGRWPR
jgi:hypothetical protein